MKLACYSDLHLEFQHNWELPQDLDANVLVLAGDIIVFDNFWPLKHLLQNWHKPVLLVAGNHEYYLWQPMLKCQKIFKRWLAEELPQVRFLNNESININGVNFFGGTMWTDFNGNANASKTLAARGINDFRLICAETERFMPDDSIVLHNEFVAALTRWFDEKLSGPHVVITHHAPVVKLNTKFPESPLQPAFTAYDAIPLIEKYQPDLWIYGHTHECDRQNIGKTKIVSNQLGYPKQSGEYECGKDFDECGVLTNL